MTPIPPIDPVGCRIARPPLRDEDGNVIDESDTADLTRRVREQARANREAAEDGMRERHLAAMDRKAVALARQPVVATVNGYRIVADTDFDGVFHVLDTDGSSIVHGGIMRCRRDAKTFDPAAD